MRVELDLTAQAAYVTVCGGVVARTVELGTALVDLAEDGAVVGVEVLDLGPLPVEQLLDAHPMPAHRARQLRDLAASWTRPRAGAA